MKAVIVYYSQGGHTKARAEKLAKKLGADLLEVAPVTPYKENGLNKFLDGGAASMKGALPELKPYTFDAAKYDTVIIGAPVWAAGIATPVRAFLKEQASALKGKTYAGFMGCFITTGGKKGLKQLAEILGAPLKAELIVRDGKENEADMDAFCKALLG